MGKKYTYIYLKKKIAEIIKKSPEDTYLFIITIIGD